MNDFNLMKTKTLAVLAAFCVSAVGQAIRAAETDTQRPDKIEASVKNASGTAQSTGADNQPVQAKRKETGLAVLKKAAQSKKYLFALFRKEENDETVAMRKVVLAAMKQVGDRAVSAEMDVTSEKQVVERLHLRGTPTPLLLAIAPNGAITAGFPFKARTEELINAIVSPGTAKCLKALQNHKLLFLCIQNGHTESNAEAMRGVYAFQQDERFADDTEIVRLDPADAGEAKFLSDLEVDPKTKLAVTVFFAPLSGRIGTFQGETNLDELVTTLVEATSGFG